MGIDAATTNGVIDRLYKKGLIKSKTDSKDKRRLSISLTAKGVRTTEQAIPVAQEITRKTVEKLTSAEASKLVKLLKKIQKT